MESGQTALGDAKVFIGNSLATARGYEATYSNLEEMKPAKLMQGLGAIETLSRQTDDQAQVIRGNDETVPQAYETYSQIANRTMNKINAELFCRTL